MADNKKPPEKPVETRNVEVDKQALDIAEKHRKSVSDMIKLGAESLEQANQKLRLENEIAAIVNKRYEYELARKKDLNIAEDTRNQSLKNYLKIFNEIKDLEDKRHSANAEESKEIEKRLAKLYEMAEQSAQSLDTANKQVGAIERQNERLRVQRGFIKEITEIVKRGLVDAVGLGEVYNNYQRGFTLLQSISLVYAKKSMELLQEVMKSSVDYVQKTGQEFSRATSIGFGYGFSSFGIGYAKMVESMATLQVSMSGYSKLSKDQQDSMAVSAAKMKLLGVSIEKTAENYNTLNKGLRMSAKESEQTNDYLAKAAIGAGIAPSKMLEGFSSAMPRLAAYGKQAIDVYVDLQKQAKSLGMEMQTLTGIVGEQFDTFEGSARAAGKLNAVLGGNYLNSVEMLNATESERVVLLKQSLDAAGKNFDSLTKYEKKALAATLGITDLNEASKLFGSSTTELSEDMQKQAVSQEKLEDLQRKAVPTIDKITQLFNSFLIIIRPIAAVLEWLVTGFTKLMDVGGGAVGVIMAIGIAIMTWKQTTAMFGLLGGGFKGAYNNVMQFKDAILSVGPKFTSLMENFKGAEGVGGKLKALFGGGAKAATDAGADMAAKGAETASTSLSEAGKKVAEMPEGAAEKSGGIKQFLINLRDGLKEFGKNMGEVLKGALTLALAIAIMGTPLVAMLIIASKYGDPAKMLAFSLSMMFLALAMKIISKVEISLKDAALFALSAIIIAAGLIPLVYAMTQLSGVDWKGTLAGVLILGLIVLALVGIGALLAGPLGILFLVGAAALLAVSATLALVALGLMVFSVAMNMLAGSIKNLTSVADDAPMKMVKLAGGIAALAASVGLLMLLGAALMNPIGAIAIGIGIAALVTVIGSLAAAISLIPEEKLKGIEQLNILMQSMMKSPINAMKEYASGIELIAAALNKLPDGKTVTLSTLNETLNTVKQLKEEDIGPTKQFVDAASKYYEAQSRSKGAEKDALVAALKEVLGAKSGNQEKEKTEEKIQCTLMVDGEAMKAYIKRVSKGRSFMELLGRG